MYCICLLLFLILLLKLLFRANLIVMMLFKKLYHGLVSPKLIELCSYQCYINLLVWTENTPENWFSALLCPSIRKKRAKFNHELRSKVSLMDEIFKTMCPPSYHHDFFPYLHTYDTWKRRLSTNKNKYPQKKSNDIN